MRYTPTPAELRAYGLMQARMLALLLRFSAGEYRTFFAAHHHFAREEDAAVLQVYRDLGVLFFLRDELFEHILPRILRRLSFAAPRQIVVEEPPGRGRIDWERTLDATWAERPGEPPLMLHARQSLRDFATAENLLTVVTLLEYRADVRRVLLSEAVGTEVEALRHPLNAIGERCERELAFPQLAGIRSAAQRILEGVAGGVEALEQQVALHAIPGGNSAYDDLLAWRRRYRELGLLRRLETDTPAAVLGADPRRDNRLYQVWIIFELADMLVRRGLLEPGTALPAIICFRWGPGPDARLFELRHDQGMHDQRDVWVSEPPDGPVPGVRPDYYIRRRDPPMTEVTDGKRAIWREPGVIWDAKYYRETDTQRVPSGPVKRMVADLALTGETRGTLLFAFLRPEEIAQSSESPLVDSPLVQRLRPAPGVSQGLDPSVQVEVAALCPAHPTAEIHQRLAHLLDQAYAALCEPLVPACHGIFLDGLSAAQRGVVADRWGSALDTGNGDLLVCPKPHIGPWRVDIVSRKLHCCSDARLCHIRGQADARKPIRPPRDAADLVAELQQILAGGDQTDLSEEQVATIARTVEDLTRHFAERLGVFRTIGVYENRLRDMGMEHSLDHLRCAERESLALALFLVEQLDSIGAQDFSAPAIHVSSVLEIAIQRRIFTCPDLVGTAALPKKQTLGLLPFMRRKPEETDGDWERLVAFVARRWDGQVIPDDSAVTISFGDFAKAIDHVAQIRNKAAHTSPVARDEYRTLFNLVCRDGPLRIGALNVLVQAWKDGPR